MDISIFKIFDIDGDGHITFEEFKKIWLNMGLSRNNLELIDIFQDIDLDNNGTIEKNELKTYIDDNIDKCDSDCINEAVNIIDNNHDQYISFFEIERIIHNLRLDISLSHLKTCFYNMNYGYGDQISIKQFMEILVKSNYNKSVFGAITHLLQFIDQSEINKVIKNTTQIKKKEILNHYRWIRQISPFNMLSRGRIYHLIKNLTSVLVSYKNPIFSYKNEITHLYIVYSGEVKLTNKKNRDISVLNSGSIICLDDIIKNKYYHYNSVSNSNNCIVWKIPILDFFYILNLEAKFNKCIFNIGSTILETHNKSEINQTDYDYRNKLKYLNNTKIDKFKHIRGFKRWRDPYPIKIRPSDYKLPPIKKPITPKPMFVYRNIPKRTAKSYSKLGKSLDIVYPN